LRKLFLLAWAGLCWRLLLAYTHTLPDKKEINSGLFYYLFINY